MNRKTISLIIILLLLAAVAWLALTPGAEPLADLPVVESQEPGADSGDAIDEPAPEDLDAATVVQGERYTSPELVAEYLHTFGQLPPNYITKDDAGDLGWVSSEGNLWDVTDEMSIGGDRFGNREGILPEADGRKYYECDVNYSGGYRGPERLVYSSDGLIFYTDDHYETFTQLY